MNNPRVRGAPATAGPADPSAPLESTRSTSKVPSAQDAVFQQLYREADYYSTGRAWTDYEPAYRYGAEAHARHRALRFEQVEAALEDGWEAAKGHSRLVWVEARDAVRDAWRSAEAAARQRACCCNRDVAGPASPAPLSNEHN